MYLFHLANTLKNSSCECTNHCSAWRPLWTFIVAVFLLIYLESLQWIFSCYVVDSLSQLPFGLSEACAGELPGELWLLLPLFCCSGSVLLLTSWNNTARRTQLLCQYYSWHKHPTQRSSVTQLWKISMLQGCQLILILSVFPWIYLDLMARHLYSLFISWF